MCLLYVCSPGLQHRPGTTDSTPEVFLELSCKVDHEYDVIERSFEKIEIYNYEYQMP
jgi:hypothetical protein